jgi:heptosyltransferase II
VSLFTILLLQHEKNMLKPEKIKNLLIRSANWIGDAVMTTPAVRAIRKNFPNARISLLAKPWVAPVFENSPYIDQIIPYNFEGALRTIKAARMLEKYGFDAAILLQNAFEAAWVACLAKIPIRIGYDTDLRKVLLTHPVHRSSKILRLHQTHYYNEILKGVGLKSDGTRLELYLSSKDHESALSILKNADIFETDFVVGINPSATFGSAKQWFPERFAKVSDRLNKRFGSKTIIFGGPNDRELGANIMKMMKTFAVDLSGKTTLKEAMGIIARCRLFITNDSGLMHIAAALNVAQVAIFGSTNFAATGPWSPRARIVRSLVDCSPCLKQQCPLGHKECMKKISVDKVFTTACDLILK